MRTSRSTSQKVPKPAVQYERNVVYRSGLTGEFFFARKVKVVSPTVRDVVGDKINVTRFIAPYLAEKFHTDFTRLLMAVVDGQAEASHPTAAGADKKENPEATS